MKKTKSILIIIPILLLLVCTALIRGYKPPREVYLENDTYTIYVQNGQYSLVPKNPLPLLPSDSCLYYVMVENPSFYSLAEMKAAIEEGRFTDKELESLQSSSSFCEEGFKICDISTLYTPTLPDGLSVQRITWDAISYNFKINQKCSISCVTPEYFDRMVKDFTEFEDKWEILSSKPDPSTGGTLYTYANRQDQGSLGPTQSAVLYTLKQGDKELRVLKECTPIDRYNKITIWGIENGAHFIVTILNPLPHHTPEWLLSFGMTPYSDQ